MGTVMADDTLGEISAGGQVSLNPVIRLWPDGPPSSLPGVGLEIAFPSPAIFGPETDMLRNVSDPSLTGFMPDPAKANGVGVVVCPGGAWRVLAWEHEGIAPARRRPARWPMRDAMRASPARGKLLPATAAARSRSSASGPPDGASSRTGSA
ncbi:MAG: hypothetical protein QOI59_3613 [Gammaproteobacteria bacterium]|nr:hypothetical protein [Gammaproteobacteria bacterium]